MRVCIECQQDVTGKKAAKVKDDHVIQFIRSIKRAVRLSKENELYVCEADLEKHNKKRKSFEKTLLIFGVLAAVVVLLMVGSLLLSGKLNITILIYSILMGVFIILLAVLFKYAPATEQYGSSDRRSGHNCTGNGISSTSSKTEARVAPQQTEQTAHGQEKKERRIKTGKSK